MPFYMPGNELGDEDIKESDIHRVSWEVSSLDRGKKEKKTPAIIKFTCCARGEQNAM